MSQQNDRGDSCEARHQVVNLLKQEARERKAIYGDREVVKTPTSELLEMEVSQKTNWHPRQ